LAKDNKVAKAAGYADAAALK
jgi:hypothetical protein